MPFEPGQSGNPSGKQTKRPWTQTLERALAQYEAGDVKAGEALRKIADRVVEGALAGDKDSVKEIAERLDGKAVQSIAGPDGENLFGQLVAAAEALRQTVR
jgi:hypothetical protein